RQLHPRQGPASDSGVGQPTSGNSAQAGSGGPGSSTSPTSDAGGSTSSSTSDTSTSSTSSSSTSSSTSSTPIITTSSTTSTSTISTSSTSSSTFSTTSLPRRLLSRPQRRRRLSRPPPPKQRPPRPRHPLPRSSDESSTTSLTTIVTSISGQLTTYTTNMPTSLATSDSGSSDVNRTALIAGVTTAAVVLAALALGAVFIYKRAQKRRIGFMETIKRIRREGKGAGAVGLLDDEFEDMNHQQYRDLPNTPVSIPRSMPPPSPPTFRTFKLFHRLARRLPRALECEGYFSCIVIGSRQIVVSRSQEAYSVNLGDTHELSLLRLGPFDAHCSLVKHPLEHSTRHRDELVASPLSCSLRIIQVSVSVAGKAV
ncbi:hypothetical protein EV421DRAFT_1948194, partial [Armillaria borealis]